VKPDFTVPDPGIEMLKALRRKARQYSRPVAPWREAEYANFLATPPPLTMPQRMALGGFVEPNPIGVLAARVTGTKEPAKNGGEDPGAEAAGAVAAEMGRLCPTYWVAACAPVVQEALWDHPPTRRIRMN
jgi:hypothetical protein